MGHTLTSYAPPDMFYSILPDHHTVKETNDEWRYQRKLMQDLMAPAFLNNIAAPQLYASFMDLIRLWTEKMRLVKGHPFSAKQDVYDTALEAIWAAVFGSEGTATITRNQIELLSRRKSMDLPPSPDDAIEFERAPAPPVFEAVLKLTDGLEYVGKSPFPRPLGFVMRHFFPSTRKNLQIKDRAMAEEIGKAEGRMAENKGDNARMTNAVDHMLRREQMAAEKQNRAPNYQSKVMSAEVSS